MENTSGTRLCPTAYNAGMGDFELAGAPAGIDAWLRDGGIVVTASERAARALTAAYHRARRAEGLSAWTAPQIRQWSTFVREEWQVSNSDDRLAMNSMQEQALWAGIIGAGRQGKDLLPGPLQRVADLAMEAHQLLCAYAPRFLQEKQRTLWQQDAAAFSGWMREFDAACNASRLVSTARIPLELLHRLESDSGERPPLLLAGFDRFQPTQRRLFDTWGRWLEAAPGSPAESIRFYHAPDAQTELEACALWSAARLNANPHARLLVVTQEAAQRRGEIERAMQQAIGGSMAAPQYEFSLGVPLNAIALVRSALLLLRWLTASLQEHEIDWLFSTGHTTSSETESGMLTAFMRALRRDGLQRTHWALSDLVVQRCGAEPPSPWTERMRLASTRVNQASRRIEPPLVWAELVPQVLEAAGWPGGGPLSSAGKQAQRRWQQVLDSCASLGFDGRRMPWSEFLNVLNRAAGETLFAPESLDAPIQIAGAAESAGLTADAIWFMGGSEEAWPPAGSAHPFLPFSLQREAAMPHSSPQRDLDFAQSITRRLLASAPEIIFSYPRQNEGVERRPARLIMACAAPPLPVPAELLPLPSPEPLATIFEDFSRVPLEIGNASGGSTVLTAQSQCPFKAFATARLAAQGWEAAQVGLTAAQRGQLLHDVLHAVWAGKPEGIRSHEDLLAVADLTGFVERHVERVFASKLPESASDCLPQRYLELEAIRLTRLVTEWLQYEQGRAPFVVAGTEQKSQINVAGLALRLRLDRIDQLNDGSFLVVDYKTGQVAVKSWESPRPEDVQLPLYALFALDREAQPLGGLTFARIRTGKCSFQGKMWNAKGVLLPALGAATALVKTPLTLDDLDSWRSCIEDLAADFIAGRADVDPRDYPNTCERCDLGGLCRVQELRPEAASDEEESSDD